MAFLPKALTGLPKDSIAMAHQIRAIAKERLRERCGSIEDKTAKETVRKAIIN